MDALVFAVVMIVQMQGNVEVGTATGFFYAAEDGRTFLVTNRHVVEPKSSRVDALKLRVHTDVNDLAKNMEVTLKLFDGGKPRYLVPRNDPKGAIDLAAVPLRKDEMSTAAIKVFTRKDAPPPKLALGYGTPVLVIGYPRSFHDEKHNAPIARQGGLASAAAGLQWAAILPRRCEPAQRHERRAGDERTQFGAGVLGCQCGGSRRQFHEQAGLISSGRELRKSLR